jgi:hypothetical protein
MPFQKGGGNGLTNQNLPLALPSGGVPTPSHIPLTWHSGTEVVTSAVFVYKMALVCVRGKQ